MPLIKRNAIKNWKGKTKKNKKVKQNILLLNENKKTETLQRILRIYGIILRNNNNNRNKLNKNTPCLILSLNFIKNSLNLLFAKLKHFKTTFNCSCFSSLCKVASLTAFLKPIIYVEMFLYNNTLNSPIAISRIFKQITAYANNKSVLPINIKESLWQAAKLNEFRYKYYFNTIN